MGLATAAAHHKMTRDLFWAVYGKGAAYDAVRPATSYLGDELRRAEALVARVSSLGLPEQQIHADLHFQNGNATGAFVALGMRGGVSPSLYSTSTAPPPPFMPSAVLADSDTVTGILDFEFTAYDWRVMEMIVGLSKYVGLSGCEAHLEAWVEGYAEAGGRLSKAERELVPDLVILRILSNVVYFVGVSNSQGAPIAISSGPNVHRSLRAARRGRRRRHRGTDDAHRHVRGPLPLAARAARLDRCAARC